MRRSRSPIARPTNCDAAPRSTPRSPVKPRPRAISAAKVARSPPTSTRCERARAMISREKSAAAAAFDAADREAAKQYAIERKPIDDSLRLAAGFRDRLAKVFADYEKFGLQPAPTTPVRESYEKLTDPVDALFDRLAKVDKPLTLLEALFIPRGLKGRRWLWLIVVFFLLLIVPAVSLSDALTGGVVAVVVAIGLAFAAKTWLSSLAKTQVSRLYYPMAQTIVDAEALAAYCRSLAEARLKDRKTKAVQVREADLQAAKVKHATTLSNGENVRDEKLRDINEVYARHVTEIQTKQQMELREAIEAYDRRKAESAAQHEASLRRLDEKYRELKEKLRARHDAAWTELSDGWHAGMTRAAAEFAEVVSQADALGPAWDTPNWTERPFPNAVPPAVRFGTVALDLNDVTNGVSGDPRLRRRGGPLRLPRASAVSDARKSDGRSPRRRSRVSVGRAASRHVSPAHKPTAGPCEVHDRRPHRHRPQLRRVHASRRLRRISRNHSSLDRGPPDQGPPGRPLRAHGESHPEISPQRVCVNRRVQRRRGRGRRTVPRAGRRRFSNELRRGIRRAGSPRSPRVASLAAC